MVVNHIIKVQRFGKKNIDRPRLMQVIFRDEFIVPKLLRSAFKLNNLEFKISVD